LTKKVFLTVEPTDRVAAGKKLHVVGESGTQYEIMVERVLSDERQRDGTHLVVVNGATRELRARSRGT